MPHFRSNENKIIAHLDNERPSDFRNKRGSVQKAMERSDIASYKDLSQISLKDADDIKRDINFFEKHPNIPVEVIVRHFRDQAESRFTIADIIQEKGRDALREVLEQLPKQKVH